MIKIKYNKIFFSSYVSFLLVFKILMISSFGWIFESIESFLSNESLLKSLIENKKIILHISEQKINSIYFRLFSLLSA